MERYRRRVRGPPARGSGQIGGQIGDGRIEESPFRMSAGFMMPRRKRVSGMFLPPLQGSPRGGGATQGSAPPPLHPGLYSRRRFAAQDIRDLAPLACDAPYTRGDIFGAVRFAACGLSIQVDLIGRRSIQSPFFQPLSRRPIFEPAPESHAEFVPPGCRRVAGRAAPRDKAWRRRR